VNEVAELSAPETVTMGMVAVMAIKMAFDTVRSMRVKNGHAVPAQASVTKETAPEFWLLQNETKQSVFRSEEMIRQIHSEVLDERVKRHHR